MLLVIALIPISIVQRYRMGTVRRLARGWVASLNVATFGLSAVLFLLSAALTSVWVPRAFGFTLAGLGLGCVLGVVGLLVSRWEPTPRALYYTPNRWLILALTLVVAARIFYGFARAWHAWQGTQDLSSWIAASEAAHSMAAGATVLGYYLMFWIGVRRQVTRYQRGAFGV